MYGKFLMVYFWQPKEKKLKRCQKAANTDSCGNMNQHRKYTPKLVQEICPEKGCLDFHRKELEKRQRRKKKASKSDQGKSQASYEYILSVSPFFPRIKRKSCEISKKECEPSTNQQNNTHQNR